ncbi:MAG: penicillin-binding protein 2 [Ruminobacter sp.]|nr:penicillin-binding protein 2 [Ruminobacter sp.]MBR1924009.1 penicillin-binding protein 2 [Ruminobacter sp.]
MNHIFNEHYRRKNNSSAENSIFNSRIKFAVFIMMLTLGILLLNLYYLQVKEYDSYHTRSNQNRIKIVPLDPPRGLIYDRNHYILADNRPLFSLEIIPESSKDLRKDINSLNELLKLELEEEEIDNIIKLTRYKRKFLSTMIAENLSEEQVAIFAINQYRFPGAFIEANLKRYYPLGETMTHALGYVARINTDDLKKLSEDGKSDNYAASNDIGKQGIEKYYEDLLHGISGYKKVEVDSIGRIQRTLYQESPKPGLDLTLSIDIRLQLKAEQLLKGKRGGIVMLNPKNGEVYAFVSSPSYDPNPFVRGIKNKEYQALLNNPNKPLINRVTQGGYAPASTVKPLLAVMGLEEDLITPHSRFFGAAYFQLPGSTHKFRDWRRGGHGFMDLSRAIEISADTYFYDLAYRAGIDRIHQYMSKFGMGKSSGIDIYEESLGNLPSKAWKKRRYKHDWVPGDTISIGIGQGYWTTTLIQLARAHAILSQNGTNVVPHILLKAHDSTRNTPDFIILPRSDKAITVKDAKYFSYAREGMCKVINGSEGTGRKAFAGTAYTACGKSGTAQVVSIKQDARYNAAALKEEHRDNALFVAFAPKENPEVLVAVIAENIGGGSKQAAPIVRAMIDDYFKYQSQPVPTELELDEFIKTMKESFEQEAPETKS